ncbi:MAG: enoyl-CoA hydratase/isomerase family protein [Pseudomonadota bacterium]
MARHSNADQPDEALLVTEAAEDHIWVRLNRPSKRNALNAALRAALRDAMRHARDRCKVVVITGTDGVFCGGIDLKEVQREAQSGSTAALTDWRELNLEIRAHPAIFIAAVNGLALGGGVTLTGVCDLAIAAADATFGMPEVGFGMYPNPAGPAAQLNLARKRAAWLVLTAERIDAATAQQWGMLNEVVAPEALRTRVRAVAERVAGFDADTLSACKRALDDIPLAVSTWRDAFDRGVGANAEIAAASEAALDGLERFSRGERNVGQGGQGDGHGDVR